MNKYTQLFHVHTQRCGHAEQIDDEEYIKLALNLGYTGIWFSDHTPFPGDRFTGRMKMDELQEYMHSLNELKKKYAEQIEVYVGLEMEYMENMKSFYETLWDKKELDFLMLGQHMAIMPDGRYTFELNDRTEECKYLSEALIAGIESNYFQYVAHPDRVFQRKIYDQTDEILKKSIVEAANRSGMQLEKNFSSFSSFNNRYGWFWKDLQTDLYGGDIHSLKELSEYHTVINETGI